MHNDLLKVENESKLYRDVSSRAIINMDEAGPSKYLQQRQRLLKTQEEVANNTQEIKDIKHELSDIKGMLTALIANIQK